MAVAVMAYTEHCPTHRTIAINRKFARISIHVARKEFSTMSNINNLLIVFEKLVTDWRTRTPRKVEGASAVWFNTLSGRSYTPTLKPFIMDRTNTTKLDNWFNFISRNASSLMPCNMQDCDSFSIRYPYLCENQFRAMQHVRIHRGLAERTSSRTCARR